MNLTNSQKIFIIAIAAAVTIAFILWPSSSDKPSSSNQLQSSENQEVVSHGPVRRFRITQIDDGSRANKLRPSEQKHIDSTKIAPGQTTLIAKDDEQYL
ncbi:MAG: hypothetical protein IJU61_14530, partial [Victivallales bacterium]|nr:hypothetical protein [Victivallales bacterium]